ncbi:hypothetical protein FACS1894219_03700 [Clostridia bacterium]|nr:hypothetical protein FACS1894219_03700 [Clostridia bacterium]
MAITELINSLGIAVWECTAERFTFMTGDFQGILGVTPDILSVPSSAFAQYVHPLDRESSKKKLADILSGASAGFEDTVRLLRSDGSSVRTHVRVVTDGKGGMKGAIAAIRDSEPSESFGADAIRKHFAYLNGMCGFEWYVTEDRITFLEEAVTTFGTPAEQLNGSVSTLYGKVHPNDIHSFRADIENYLSGQARSFSSRLRIKTADGKYTWYQISGSAAERDDKGRPVIVRGGVLNINNFAAAEESLRNAVIETEAANRRLKVEAEAAVKERDFANMARTAMFESNPYMNIIFSDHFRVIDCNPAALKYMRYGTREEFCESFMEHADYIFPENEPRLTSRLKDAAINSFTQYTTEVHIHGRTDVMHVTMKRIPYGTRFAIAVYLTDMTDIRRAELGLAKRGKLLTAVNETVDMVISGMTGGISEESAKNTSHKALEILARSIGADRAFLWEVSEKDGGSYARRAASWIGCKFCPEAPSLDTQYPLESITSAIGIKFVTGIPGFEPVNASVEDLPPRAAAALSADGLKALLVTPIVNEGIFRGFFTFEDFTTEREFEKEEVDIISYGSMLTALTIQRAETLSAVVKAKDEAIAGMKAKSEFLSRMSHEFRTPMNAIIGMSAIAMKAKDLSRVRHCVSKVNSASRQLLAMIGNILDMSNIEAGSFGITESEFDFGKMIEQTIEVIKVKLEEKSQTFKLEFPEGIRKRVIADEYRLSQVFINLLTNAVKFTSDYGIIALRINFFQLDSENAVIHAEVEDSGIGITGEARETLWNAFEQGDKSLTRRYGGTGLGLAVTKKVVNLMGGDIWFESEPGEGTRFTFEVKVKLGDPLTPKGYGRKRVDEPRDWAGKRILLVEDIEINREIAADMLQDTGAEIDVSENGLAAVGRFQSGETYDAVLMDVHMPMMDGLSATRKIRALGAATPIIAMTANAFKEDEQACRDAGMDSHIAKPIDLETLLWELDVFLG